VPGDMSFTRLTEPSSFVTKERSKILHLEALEKEYLLEKCSWFYEIKYGEEDRLRIVRRRSRVL